MAANFIFVYSLSGHLQELAKVQKGVRPGKTSKTANTIDCKCLLETQITQPFPMEDTGKHPEKFNPLWKS